jgi:hypothetical protein
MASGRVRLYGARHGEAAARGLCEPSRMGGVVIVDVPAGRLNELAPLWRALYDRHSEVTPHLRDRARPFEQAWFCRTIVDGESGPS